MTIVERSALVHYPPGKMFDLVNEVDRYHEFLKWCQHSEILEQDAEMMLAKIGIRLAGVERTFITRNRLAAPGGIDIHLVEGPFRDLLGEWRFSPLGESGCKVTLKMTFEFSSQVLSGAFRHGFSQVANRLVTDFCARAETVYG